MAQARLKQIIVQWLRDHGELSTREIYDLFLDNKPNLTPTMYQLGSVMGRLKDVECVGSVITDERIRRKRHALWRLRRSIDD